MKSEQTNCLQITKAALVLRAVTRHRRGFSFTEVMFAVVILGIGFIMIAAVFPVAISQTQTSGNETVSASMARSSLGVLETFGRGTVKIATGPDKYVSVFPQTCNGPVGSRGYGRLFSMRDGRLNDAGDPVVAANGLTAVQAQQIRASQWASLCRNFITQADARYAWVPFYRRDVEGPVVATGNKSKSFLQVVMIGVQVRSKTSYDPVDIGVSATGACFNLQPRPVQVEVYYDATLNNYVAAFGDVKGESWAMPNAVGAVDVGSYFVISDDRVTFPLSNVGRMNGRIFRCGPYVGVSATGEQIFQVDPTQPFTPDGGASGSLNDAANDDISQIGRSGGETNVDGQPLSGNITVTGPAFAFVIGKGLADPNYAGAAAFEGAVQDISAFTTFVPAEN